MIACRNGHYDIAYYLLHNIGIDCEQTGSGEDYSSLRFYRHFYEKLIFISVTFDGETIESAPPLW